MYKSYNTNKLTLPMDIQVLIPQQHLVRLIDFAVDRMNLNIFLSLYAHNLLKWVANTENEQKLG